MKASFVINKNFLPRATRKALRVTTPRQTPAHDNGVDTYMAQCDYRTDNYHNTNLYTMEYDCDEFNDIDDEYEGLTIVECSGEAELFEFCTGYNI